MATNFPTSLDNFTNPSSGNTLDSPSHSLQHSDANDAIEAIEAKLGVGASPAGSATAGQVLTISAAGTSGWSTPTRDGLVQVIPTSVAVGSGSGSVDGNGTVTFSGASSVSLNTVFSSTYENYRVIITPTTGSGTLTIRLRASGTDASGSNYILRGGATGDSTFAREATNSGTSWAINNGFNDASSYCLDIFQPQIAKSTTIHLTATNFGSATSGSYFNLTGGHIVSTAYDGFTIAATSMTGAVYVYGYRK